MAKDEKKTTQDSVKQRKKSAASAVQNYLPIAEIRQDTVFLKNGGIRAVIAVGSMNFSLKSEDEQQAIVNSYQSFVNTLSFPVQIVVRSTQLNVDAYISDLQERASKQKNPLLKEQTLDYARYIEKLVEVAEIMQKRFYCIVPVDPPGLARQGFFAKYLSWLRPADSREKALSRARQFEEMGGQLRDRVNIVTAGLGNVGLIAERMTTPQLIDLYYNVYNPKTSQDNKLPGFGDLNAKEYIL